MQVGLRDNEVEDSRPRLRSFLTDKGFIIDSETTSNDFSVIAAHQFTCDVKVSEISSSGWHEDLIRKLASPRSAVVFFYEGKSWNTQPRWRSWSHKHWRNLNAMMARTIQHAPVIGMVASEQCDLDRSSWAEISVP